MARHELWSTLSYAFVFSKPWLVIGDFNAVLRAHEKTGLSPLRISCEGFLEKSFLVPIDLVNTKFTWVCMGDRSYVEGLLDRALCS